MTLPLYITEEEVNLGTGSGAGQDPSELLDEIRKAIALASADRKGLEDLQKKNAEKPTVGIITALPKEHAAVKAMLEKVNPFSFEGSRDVREYVLGEIPTIRGDSHSVVLLRVGQGTNLAAAETTLLLERFPNVKSVVVVGIGGGVPNPNMPDEHVRLGDVVVSDERGIIQYDFIKKQNKEIIFRNQPRPPSAILLRVARNLQEDEIKGHCPWLQHIERGMQRLKATRPPQETDILFDATDPAKKIAHPRDPKRIDCQPRIFIGPIASANTLLKDPVKRDRLRDQFGVKAVEMESSGIADAAWTLNVGYLAVRGICDYCDMSKGDAWQEYAAIVAAAYARALLESMPCSRIKR